MTQLLIEQLGVLRLELVLWLEIRHLPLRRRARYAMANSRGN